MQNRHNIIQCYDKTAVAYAKKFANELNIKIFDNSYLKAFAGRNIGKGQILDLGCGPGHHTKFLTDQGCSMIGVDLSSAMINIAKQLYEEVDFETGDMLKLRFLDESLHGALALYSIIHFDYNTLRAAFAEINRVLVRGSEFLFSFHIGDETLNNKEFLGEIVDIDFYLLNVSKIRNITSDSGFSIIEVIERYPYPEIEYQSKRAYILARKE